ncbi:MAG: phage antirepressor [Gluconacetobacter sp.]|uniref:Phage antitermination protein n=1 Tax=Gluconacetobacter dulcium TaxID=2729096 RepID=A0A7W4K2V9_9PROT|nr:phage antirepressor [Gluconacetobacter dulcium]MBB2199371.1 phage antitermination protein [Gluconacetobacter dulcium]
MNALVQQYAFQGHPVGTVTIDGLPFFIGKDVCERLGYANPNKAMNDHCKGVTKRYPLQTPGGMQEVRVLSEPDVMRLIVRCKRPEAEPFERWVFEEVLPTIRRTGGYVMSAPGDSQADLVARALSAAEEAIRRQGAAIDTLAPKAAAYDRLAQSTDQVSLTEGAKALGRPRDQFLAMLHEHRWIYRQKPGRPWLAHADKERSGLLVYRVTDIPDRDGRLVPRHQVLLTAKGLTHLGQLLPKWESTSC